MSAIWGIVDLRRSDKKKEGSWLADAALRMDSAYDGCRIDRIDREAGDTYYLACGIQNVVPGAEREHFPYAGEAGSRFVADVILDNPEELAETAGAEKKLTDGELLFQSYVANPESTLSCTRGTYAAAYLERDAGRLTLFNDAVGNRSVYYCRRGSRILFSTLLEGILRAEPEGAKSVRENRAWFRHFYRMRDLRAAANPRETPYRGIYRLAPGEIVVFSAKRTKRRSYWDPFRGKPLTGKSDAEYRELVNRVFRSCVEDVLRRVVPDACSGGREVGILLSGGLDSNAVAAYAAPYLAGRGRKLYSFTSVPEERERPFRADRYEVEDERGYVERVREKHPNLYPAYLVTHRGDLLSENRELVKLLEVPFKAVLNLPWLYEGYREAAARGCAILLNGQYGNITISYGDFESLFVTLLHRGKFWTLWREITIYGRKYRKRRLEILWDILWNGRRTHRWMRRHMYDRNALRQIGEYEVKLSLATGVIPRDPTRDPRLIELVLALPVEQFVRNGRDRRLVREYMDDRIPAEVLAEFHKGRQAVGSGELLEEQWEEICKTTGWRSPAIREADRKRELLVRAFYTGLTEEYRRRFQT